MYKFLVWSTAISLAPLTVHGLLAGASKHLGDSAVKSEVVRNQVSVVPVTHGPGGLQDRKVISTGAEVWQGIERRSAGRRAPDTLRNALYTTSGCDMDCDQELKAAQAAPRHPRSPDAISF